MREKSLLFFIGYAMCFRLQHSTTTALLSIINDIFKAFDESSLTCLVLRIIINTLENEILYKNLRIFCFLQRVLVPLKNIFLNCTQRTYGIVSKALPVSRGILQGSILGPLLFNLLISYFHQHASKFKIHHQADSTQHYFSFKFQNIELVNLRSIVI